MAGYPLAEGVLTDQVAAEPIRVGFGRGLLEAGRRDERVVALCADLTDSTQMSRFLDAFPDRFVEVGIAEQNLVTVAAGMARAGMIPFTSSYAAFSPGRNWEQIKTSACLNELPVKVVGSHAGLITGKDGATHQMLEDIALMRVLPGMVVVCPGDSIEAEKATVAIAANDAPSYLRLARDATPVFTTPDSPFELGRAYVLREGSDVTLAGTGALSYELLVCADLLAREGIEAEVIHMPTVKPLDEETLLASATRTGAVVTAEEAQVAGGFGGAVAELLSACQPSRLLRLGVEDRYGESGDPRELLEAFGLTGAGMAQRVRQFLSR
ncbi:transketolase family protein [Raineyella fluvialis]|uniref:Transketolase family protein n=1 Tax=Raineyella fluvialis TaxID=2662261 RepID=A0A5Q2F8H0_9ACTN|nr:transketolase C-terminal domain-containing protein [Raineyella fluvialis]QGF23260.1 transketolase family protein [Raineyella fluvialis]